MLIDINANIGHWPFHETNFNSCIELLEKMDEFGVDISVVSNMNGIFYNNTQAANEELYEELMSDRHFRNRFIPFGVINPIYPGWKHDLEICINKMGMKGIRLYPEYHDYNIRESSCIELVKNARDKGLIIAFTCRMIDTRGPRHWMDTTKERSLADIIPIIEEVPDAKYFILNVSQSMNMGDKEFELFKKADILIDTSGRRISNPGELLKTFGKYKFAFGTHSPLLDYVTGMLRIEALRESEAGEDTKELLRSGNARKFLRI